MDKDYSKTALVTGAANGLGRALAVELYRRGWHLALLDVDAKGLARLKSELPEERRNFSFHTTDIADEQQVMSAREAVLRVHPHVDLLINNAGVSISQLFENLDIADFRRLFEVNFWGTVYCTKHFLPDLQSRPTGHIVNIISDFALMGFPGKTAYGASKSAVMGFSNALKTELAGSSVHLSVVIPPPLDTEIVKRGMHIDEHKRQEEMAFLAKNGMPLDRAARKIINRVELKRDRIVIGTMMFWTDWVSRMFPVLLHRAIGKYKKYFKFI